ncbi:hypothetical protein D9758_010695 [Tetrapyrgos nigripes]|uniref:Glucose-methanol-choline oxidoreductase N-terminal domain-containing protein n=1 Tax=Tetrapyrgos nigripes TaxID=182062 RepID=A0A8H5GG70_9AGAR|nr:hypothetical protein D9758_010695 [Tetrapyrgos nigripes]
MWPELALLILHLFVALCSSRIIEHIEDLPTRTFDFVVVGGGTAGNVIASRLTENPGISVLVLEAGGSNEGVLLSMVPGFCGRTVQSAIDWNFTAQVGQDNRTIEVPRGFILGGSSSINCMAYTRGSSEDWDRYADVTGDPGWSWDNVQPFIRKNEHFTPPVDKHNTTGQFDPAVHSFDGVNSVTLPGFTHHYDELVIQSSKLPGAELPFNLDTNSGNQLGIGWGQSTVLNGQRSSSATSYLGPTVAKRSNLHVLLHAHVTRILKASRSQSSFTKVELTQNAGETFEIVSATKEIIISAGAIGTPNLLLNSGIGDSESLLEIGIPSTLHLPSVGQNLTEQPAVTLAWNISSPQTNSTDAEQLEQWMKTPRSGPLVDAPLNTVGFFRLPANASIFTRFRDPSAGPHTAHLEIVFTNDGFGLPGNVVSSAPAIVSPASRGFVKLNSSNLLDHPMIDLNLLSSEFDLFAMREGLRMIVRFMASPPFEGFLLSSNLNIDDETTDDDLDAVIRSRVGGAAHLVGTASMSPKDADWGVVDPDLKLKGAQGVRIADASVLPFVPAAHTQASVYIVAERASHLIKNTWDL